MGILIGVFCVAVFMDWQYYRIPNACVLTGGAAGLIMASRFYAAAGFLEAVGMAAVIFLAFYPFFFYTSGAARAKGGCGVCGGCGGFKQKKNE